MAPPGRLRRIAERAVVERQRGREDGRIEAIGSGRQSDPTVSSNVDAVESSEAADESSTAGGFLRENQPPPPTDTITSSIQPLRPPLASTYRPAVRHAPADPLETPADARRRAASRRAAFAVAAFGSGGPPQPGLPTAKPVVSAKKQGPVPDDAAQQAAPPLPQLDEAGPSTPRTPSPPASNPAVAEQRPVANQRRWPSTKKSTGKRRSTADDVNDGQTGSATPDPEPYARDFEWPEYFLDLERTFRAVNTVYAFCSGRKHLATTYDTIKSSVEGIIKRPLDIFDLAQIKSLCPDLINLAYVDHDALEIHLDGTRADSEDQSKSKWRADRQDKVDAYESFANMPTDEAQPLGTPISLMTPAQIEVQRIKDKRAKRDEYVLLFEFNDGTLLGGPKAVSRSRPGMRSGPSRNPAPTKKAKLGAAPSAAGMQRLINKRNFKFEQAVIELLMACKVKDEDPVQLLNDAARDHVPVNPEQQGPGGALTETPQKRRIRLEYLMANPEERPPIADLIEEMKGMPWWKDQIVPGGRRTIKQREARYEDLTFVLSQAIVNALWGTRGIDSFYLHQAEALNALDDGYNVIVSTSTSSGKSLIYQIPVLRALEENHDSTALFIFPTKALAQDQLRALQDLLAACDGLEDTVVATYDGDTDRDYRKGIRERANVIFTNPDMLHQSILPSEDLWRRFLRGLRYVVVDELHSYNGLFGAHVSFIMRRLRRICAALGNRRVKFVSCSATIANPADHMQTVFGVEEVQVITEDGSPAGNKEWVVWNPPLIDPNDVAQGRVSAYAEVSRVFRFLIERGVRTIIFAKVRRTAEIVMRQVRDDLLLDDRHDVARRVKSYRSGYSAQERRQIEQDMFRGELLGIVATSALELGIDIGTLDAVIMLGFPYSISSLRQQAGRAGRRQKDSLALLIGDPFPLDQHYMRNPEEIFNQPDTELNVDLTNDFILEGHLQCAAEEMPVHPNDDVMYFGESLAELCSSRLVGDKEGFYHCREDLRPNPSREIAIRGARQETYTYIDDTPDRRGGPRILEEVEIERAIFEAYDGGVFMHQGRSYICHEVSHDRRIAHMVQADVNFHTRPRDHTDVDAVETMRIRAMSGSESLRAYYGKVTITSHVWGYFKVDRRANILDAVDVETPPYYRHTHGVWLDVPQWIVDALLSKTINAAAAIHAAEHAILSLTPVFVVSLAGEVLTDCKVPEREYMSRTTQRLRPARIILYDKPGQSSGSGTICTKVFEHLDALMRIAVSVIEACSCAEGCPGCVTSVTCAHANVVSSKVGALAVLRGLIGREDIFDPDLPQQHEPTIDPRAVAAAGKDPATAGSLTISQAPPVPASRDAPELSVEVLDERLPPSTQRRLEAAMVALAPAATRARPGQSLAFDESDGESDAGQGLSSSPS